jgi:hypothetical protein
VEAILRRRPPRASWPGRPSRSWVSRNGRWVAAFAVAGIMLVAVGELSGQAYRGDGPLVQEQTWAIEFPLAPGQSGTWGVSLPRNTTSSAITIESVDLLNPAGLEIVGIGVNDPAVDGGIGTAYGFPPAGATLAEPMGAVIPPNASADLQVLVGVRLVEPGKDGTIDALRVRYRHQGVRYEVLIPDRLRLFTPPAPDA